MRKILPLLSILSVSISFFMTGIVELSAQTAYLHGTGEFKPENKEILTETRETSTASEIKSPEKFTVGMKNGKAVMYKNGEPFFIKGIGGTSRLDYAASCGANAFRTWDADISETSKELEKAQENGMYLMMGIWLSHDKDDYLNDNYKNELRKKVRELAAAFKSHPNLMIWCLGNEVNLEGADTKEAWEFVNELAGLIKSHDQNHPVATVISYSESAVNNIADHAPNIDVIGFNAYGGIYGMTGLFERSRYKGPYMVSEWGPNGHWENGTTAWGAPIEPSSEEKKIEYERRYKSFIQDNDRCIGSFVFLWGQKQERTPTWYSLFVENNVAGLPLKGEACPTVEAMERLWKGTSELRVPIVNRIKLNGKNIREIKAFEKGEKINAYVEVQDRENEKLTYVWEILKEAVQLGVGGSFEPRPDRIGKVINGKTETQEFNAPSGKGNYRLFVYVLNGTGTVGTANIPFQVD